MTEGTGAPSGTIGVVGLGAMGLPIANALTTNGSVVVYDAAPAAASRASAVGLRVAGSLVELARSCNTVLLSLPSAAVVEDVVSELAPAAPGLLLLDTSTIGPEDSRRIGALAMAEGSAYLDTPVLGRPEMVGSWTIPVGGPVAAYDTVAAILEPVARRVVHVGELGSAATLKVANNLMFSVINAVTAEALMLAQAAGLDPGVFVDTVVDSGAATVSGLFRSVAPRAVDGDFRPPSPSTWSARTTTSPYSSPPRSASSSRSARPPATCTTAPCSPATAPRTRSPCSACSRRSSARRRGGADARPVSSLIVCRRRSGPT